MRDIRCFPRFALPVRYPNLICLCFAIPCGTVPAQPLFLTVLDRHSIAPSCTLLPCRCCLLLGFTHALSCHAIAMPNHAKPCPCDTMNILDRLCHRITIRTLAGAVRFHSQHCLAFPSRCLLIHSVTMPLRGSVILCRCSSQSLFVMLCRC